MKSYQAEGSAVVTAMGAHICYGDSEDHAQRIADGMNEAADVRGTLLAALCSAQKTIGVLKTFCSVPLTVVRAAETEHEIERAIAQAESKI